MRLGQLVIKHKVDNNNNHNTSSSNILLTQDKLLLGDFKLHFSWICFSYLSW
jgi:hypothetical protein